MDAENQRNSKILHKLINYKVLIDCANEESTKIYEE